jgi:hypothetical protein
MPKNGNVRLRAGDVRLDHPLAVHSGVGDQQAPRLGLLEQRHRGQVVPEGLVGEPLGGQVEQQGVLAVVERETDEVPAVGERDTARDEVAVGPGAVRAGRSADLPRQPQPVTPARGVGAQRDRRGRPSRRR